MSSRAADVVVSLAHWPDGDESTTAAVDAVLTADRTEQRRNSVTATDETAGRSG
jgi:hypothetical protein